MGKCKLQKLDTIKSILFVSGRLSSEMVTKAVMHKIPIVVSRTAPTYLGVQTAHKHGLTLIGFARGKKMKITLFTANLSRHNYLVNLFE